jgi:hypothetical protein
VLREDFREFDYERRKPVRIHEEAQADHTLLDDPFEVSIREDVSVLATFSRCLAHHRFDQDGADVAEHRRSDRIELSGTMLKDNRW